MRPIELKESLFEGAVSLETGDGWVRPWRLPCSKLRLFPPDDALVQRAGMPSGVRLRFKTNASALALGVVPAEAQRKFDLTIEGELLQTMPVPPGQEIVEFEDLPAGEKVVELWLSQDRPVALRGLFVEDGADLTAVEDSRPKWIAYGSSITHCGGAHSPARTWPACAARKRRLNLTCLGYGGNCHLEPMVARMIRDMPADFISLKVGVNIYGGASLSGRTFRPAVIGFVQTIRETHRDIPIAVISPIISPPRENQPNAVGLTLSVMREQVADAVERMIDSGDKDLHYFDGRRLFGEDLVERYLPDQLHPNGDGYERLGGNFLKVVLGEIRL